MWKKEFLNIVIVLIYSLLIEKIYRGFICYIGNSLLILMRSNQCFSSN